jgi:predicted aspartyl protease
MIRYAYNRQLTPPAPFVHVTLRCIETGHFREAVPAQLDTAADRTVIPGSLISELGLVPIDELPIIGFGGQLLHVRTYLIELTIRDLVPVQVEAVGHSDEPYVLLGRDVLNQHLITLDGPHLAVEVH